MYTIIRNNRKYLLDNIEINDELIASLLSLNCITEEQCHFIQRQRTTRNKKDTILHVMRSSDEKKIVEFVKCLREANQKTVAKSIENGGGLKYKHYLKTLLLPNFSQRISQTAQLKFTYSDICTAHKFMNWCVIDMGINPGSFGGRNPPDFVLGVRGGRRGIVGFVDGS